MVCLVQNAAGRKVADVQLKFLSRNVVCPNDHPCVSLHLLIEPRKRKTSFVADLLAFDMKNLWVDERVLLRRAIFVRNVHHKDPLRNSYLRSSKPNASGLIHRGEHLIDQFLKFLSKTLLGHRFRDRKQNGVRIVNDLQVQHKTE